MEKAEIIKKRCAAGSMATMTGNLPGGALSAPVADERPPRPGFHAPDRTADAPQTRHSRAYVAWPRPRAVPGCRKLPRSYAQHTDGCGMWRSRTIGGTAHFEISAPAMMTSWGLVLSACDERLRVRFIQNTLLTS